MNPSGDFYFEGTGFRASGARHAGLFEEGDFYEVLRVMEGTCLFVTDHLHRLLESMRLSGIQQYPDPAWIQDVISQLIIRNHMVTGNIKLVLKVMPDGRQVLHAFGIPFSYPAAGQYTQGVPAAIYKSVRVQPNVKRIVPALQDPLRIFIEEKQVYEALLADEQDRLLEGSRTNVFFIRNCDVVTAPGDMVLKGITRMKVFSLCNKLHINLIEEAVSISCLTQIEGVFLSGTSPKILPVCRIDDRAYPVNHPLLKKLMVAYDQLLREEIETSKSRTAR